jgi:hypothetical protein
MSSPLPRTVGPNTFSTPASNKKTLAVIQARQKAAAEAKQAKIDKRARFSGRATMGTMFAAPVIAGLIDSKMQESPLQSTLSGAATGAGIGAIFGPQGIAIGAGIGAAAGAFQGVKRKSFNEKFSGISSQTKDPGLTKSLLEQIKVLENMTKPLDRVREAFSNLTDDQVESAKAFALSTMKERKNRY